MAAYCAEIPRNGDFPRKHLETIFQPAQIQEGDYGTLMAIRFYAKTPLTSKYLIAVYREVQPDDGFVLRSCLKTPCGPPQGSSKRSVRRAFFIERDGLEPRLFFSYKGWEPEFSDGF